MRCFRLFLALHAACPGVAILTFFVCTAAYADPPGRLSEMPLPGGVPAALAVIHDTVPADRAQFLIEVIRRVYATPVAARSEARAGSLRALLAHLERQRQTNAPASTIPLPLTPAIWVESVFGGRTNEDALAAAILESRNASLLYYGLMSLDGPTREWIGSQRTLITDLAARYAPVFAVASSGFRVSAGRVRLPGGERFDSAWEALVGRRAAEPTEFLRALLTMADGRLAYVLAALSESSDEQVAFALGGDPANASAALRRLVTAFDRAAPGWKIGERTFWRPRRDPALLLSDLSVDGQGRPTLSGSRAFWTAVFSPESQEAERRRGVESAVEAPDFAWLVDQIFFEPTVEQRRRYEAVLFASRVMQHGAGGDLDDVVETIRSAWRYPALAAALERAHAANVAVYAAASRRAARISSIGNEDRRLRALAQYQGTIALLGRMASRGSLAPADFEAAVTALSHLELDRDGEYDGAVVRWFAGWLASRQVGTAPDSVLLQMLAGATAAPARYVDWEGTHYRLDLAAAEMVRLSRLLGEQPPSYLAEAQAQRGSGADDAWARGVTELVYATALGQPERAAVSVADLARRHDFGVRGDIGRTFGPWTLPVSDITARGGYHVGGALLCVDTALAEFALSRVSTKTPPRKPTVSSEERAVFVGTVPLVEPAWLSDDDRDRIASALKAGRTRVAGIASADEGAALVEAMPMGSIRRTVFPWIVAHDGGRAASFFSAVELLRLGLGGGRLELSAQRWGVSVQPRTGCVCLQVADRRSGDVLTGRVNAGILASGFPDLGLRLAELLSDLRMPAALFGGVLASATFDFVNGAVSRDEDDRRGLIEYVMALRSDRVEEYLALLTTGGPLVPPRDSDRLEGVAPARRQP